MRQIKFRGLKVRASNDTEGFAYGHYTEGSPGWHYITTPDGSCFRVDPKSIGEYTGLKDKNGKEIYEGDIYDVNGATYAVFFHMGAFVGGKSATNSTPLAWDAEDVESGDCKPYESETIRYIEVIGNIHESPSLLTNQEKG